MASNIQSFLEFIQMNNYVSIAITTAVTYDYSLNCPREADYVWRKPWTWVSTVFFVVRYVGLTWAILSSLVGSTFIPGPQREPFHSIDARHGYPEGAIVYFTADWAYLIYLFAADFVMILRVYAMWNRSNRILWILLLIYTIEIVTSVVPQIIIDSNPTRYVIATVSEVDNFSFCNTSTTISTFLLSSYQLPRFILGATLLVLASIQTLKQSVQMYRATKLWEPNRYIQLLMRDGIIYFLVNLGFNVIGWIENGVALSNNLILFLTLFTYIGLCTMMPRFIIGIRELFDRDLHGRIQGIDTGFGVLSQPIASQHTIVSAIEFVDVTPGQGSPEEEAADELDGIRLEAREGNVSHV